MVYIKELRNVEHKADMLLLILDHRRYLGDVSVEEVRAECLLNELLLRPSLPHNSL